jgi:hypothetical protein
VPFDDFSDEECNDLDGDCEHHRCQEGAGIKTETPRCISSLVACVESYSAFSKYASLVAEKSGNSAGAI